MSRSLPIAAVLLIGAGLFIARTPGFAESVVKAPAPALSVPATAPRETAVFAGGCFWGVQGVYAHVKGVVATTAGYTGGASSTAEYESVSTGGTGHAESVKVVFDPRVVSYADLLRIYFSVVADPTELNRQGPDEGPQYRSAIFPQNPAQEKVARAYIAQLGQAHLWQRPIVTRIEPAKAFYPAEAHHQNFMALNPDYPYIVINDRPKVEGLKKLFPQSYKG
jgi:peptide-methionine (S)-S-oxide reductase